MANTVRLAYSGAEINNRLAQVMKNVSALAENFEKDREFRDNFLNSSYVTTTALSNYALKTDIPDVSNFDSKYATKDELAALFSNTTTEEIDSLVEVIDILNNKYDASQIAELLNNYLTESDAENLYQKKGNYQPAGSYVTTNTLNNTLNNYATLSYVGAEIYKLLDGVDDKYDTFKELVDLLNTKQNATDAINALKDKADLSYVTERFAEFALLEEIPTSLSELYNDASYIVASDLEGYAKTEDLPSVEGLISEQNADAKYQLKGLYLVASDLEGYVKTEDLPEVPSVEGLISEQDADAKYQLKGSYLVASDLEGYAKTEDLPSVEGLISEQNADAKYQLKGSYLVASDLEGYAKTADLPEVPTKISAFENDSDYATVSYVNDNFATKNDVNSIIEGAPEALNTLNEIAAYFAQYPSVDRFTAALNMKADKSDLNQYMNIQNTINLLNSYVKKTELQTAIDPLAVKSEVTNEIDSAIANLHIEDKLDTSYLSTLATKEELAPLAVKSEVTNEIDSAIANLHMENMLDKTYLSTLATKEELQDAVNPLAVKSEVTVEIDNAIANLHVEDKLDASYLSTLATKEELEPLALKSEIPTVPTLVSAFENDANYLTEHQSLEDYALKADLENYVEKKLSESDSFNLIYNETTWNDSYENGALHKYYTKYPDEDLWSVELQRIATFNDKCYDVEIYSDATCETLVKNATLKASWETSEVQKVTDAEAGASYYTVKDVEVDGVYELFSDNINSMSAGLFIKVKGISFPGFTQCWDGAVKAPGAKYPWVAVYFDEDVNSVVKFQYEGKDDVYPWGSKIFGKGNGHKEWGFASVAEEFKDNSFLIPENAANANPEWDGEVGTQSTFDISKFKVILVNQEDANSVKDYVVSEIARVEAEIPEVPTNVSAFENDAEYLTEHQSLVGYATEKYVDDKISYLLDGVDENFDTFKELVAAINDNDSEISTINDALNAKANVIDVYNISAADDKFVDKAKYDELNAKYTTLFNVVYQNATGNAATALNADYVANNLSNENTSVEIVEGELGDVTIPETTKAMSVTAPMQDESTITLSSPKAFTLINTSENPVDVTIDAPAGTSIPTMSLSGNFENLTVNNGSVGAKSGANPLTVTYLNVDNEINKNITVSGVVFNDESVITTYNAPTIGIANNNTDQNAPNTTINAENSTVTLNKGQWNEIHSNVSDNTLIVTGNAHINTLNVVKGNVVVYDREVANRINNVVNETAYTVACRETNVTTGNELNSALTGNPGIVNVMNDITRGRITWGIFGAGNYLLDLKGNTVTISDATFGLKTRNTVNLKIIDSGDGNGNYGKFINDKSYGLWAGENTVITIDVPEETEIIGVTHTLYCEGSGHPTINVLGGTYKMTIEDSATDVYDANGNYKFLLNHYDATYTREGNCFNITGGTFYGFDPSKMYGDPYTDPVTGVHYYSMIDTNAYESQIVDTFVDSRGTTMNVYKVVKK